MKFSNASTSTSLYAPVASERPGVTMSFRAFADHAALIHAAARAAGTSTAAFMRKVCLEWAAAEQGLSPPDMGRYTHSDSVTEAAKAQGMTPREFITAAAREAAAHVLATRSPATTSRTEPASPLAHQEATLVSERRSDERSASGMRRRVGG